MNPSIVCFDSHFVVNRCFKNIFFFSIYLQVDMSKVKLDVLRPWISKKITDILHIEDDVVVEFVYNQLEEDKVSYSLHSKYI